jgi:hypothetical protein
LKAVGLGFGARASYRSLMKNVSQTFLGPANAVRQPADFSDCARLSNRIIFCDKCFSGKKIPDYQKTGAGNIQERLQAI